MEAKEAEETIAEIVAEFREMVHKSVDGIIAVKADVIADRIEAAWKREIVSRRSIKIPIEIMLPCNAAAMREALEFCVRQMSDAICSKDFGDDVVYLVGCMKTCIEHMKAALSEPPRNCDVGTAEEQERRYDHYCHAHINQKNCCGDCPLSAAKAQCEFAWAQMPYEADAKKEKSNDAE